MAQGWTPDKRPARNNYWNSRRLMIRKIKSLMESNGMTEKEATEYWIANRKGRKK